MRDKIYIKGLIMKKYLFSITGLFAVIGLVIAHRILPYDSVIHTIVTYCLIPFMFFDVLHDIYKKKKDKK